MQHPTQWRETADPYALPFRQFVLKEILGYPHAGNDVFHAKGLYKGRELEVYIKIARQQGADLLNEAATIRALNSPLAPQIIECDQQSGQFLVTVAKQGERLSVLVGDNRRGQSLEYMFEYGQALATLHANKSSFPPVKDRRFFHIPSPEMLEKHRLGFVYTYLMAHRPQKIHTCFCHGDFHYANLLWQGKQLSAILDFELSGMGNREFDIAWAIILRPEQTFLNTEKEIALFRQGYMSLGDCDWQLVDYYMVLIYAYFYQFGTAPPYRAYVKRFFETHCC